VAGPWKGATDPDVERWRLINGTRHKVAPSNGTRGSWKDSSICGVPRSGQVFV